MREIKFRAWVLQDEIDGEYVAAEYMEDNVEAFHNPLYEHKQGNIVLMQYTGLKDKDNKEIYEGDILKVNKLTFENSGSLPENLVVKFYNGMFQLFRGDEYLYGLHLMYIEDGEVIGNIYENQNLIK